MSHGRTDSQAAITNELERAGNALKTMMRGGRSFSGNERNCCFLNTGAVPNADGRFANISAVSGLDYPDDGRAVALVDWDHDGRLDMWISNRNAPRLRLMRNEVPRGNHFLALKLQGNGKNTNRDAVGARVEVVLGSAGVQTPESDANEVSSPNVPIASGHKPLLKTLRAGEGLLAQSSKWLHFGLGSADVIDKVTVHWPGGEVEQFTGIHVDNRYLFIQGSGTARDTTQPARETRLVRSTQKVLPASQVSRIRMVQLPTVPKPDYVGFDGQNQVLATETGRLLLVNLWASWCAPCLTELSEFSRRYDELQAKGIDILALSVEGLDGDESARTKAARLASNRKFPFPTGQASSQLIADFNYLHNLHLPLLRELPLPCSFLIDREGRLAVIYKGPVSIEELLEDVSHSEDSRLERLVRSASFAGQLIRHPRVERIEDNSAVSLRFLLAEYLQHSGRADQAARQYADVLKLRPDNSGAHNNLGNILLGHGKIAEAIEQYQQALRISPDDAGTHNNLGNALQGQGKIAEAIEHYQQALQIDPDDATAYNNLGNALQGQGKIAEAIEHYQQALQIMPDYANAHYNLGITLQEQGKIVQATDHYQQALKFEPDYAQAHYNLGIVLREQGKIAEAIEHYQQALRLNPDNAMGHNNLGNALQGQGNLVEAVEHYQRALRIKPDFAQAHNNLGNALKRQGKLVEAIEHHQRALQIKPDFAQAHNSLAIALEVQGDFPAAVRHYTRALELNPELPLALNNLAWIRATHADTALRDGIQAVELAERCCGLPGLRVPATLDTLAAAYAEAGRFDEAIETASQAIDGATAAGNEKLAQIIRGRLDSYLQRAPYRETNE